MVDVWGCTVLYWLAEKSQLATDCLVLIVCIV